jgi:polysaccharide export outer membrane protein
MNMNDMNDMNKDMKDMKKRFIYNMTIVVSFVMLLVAPLAAQNTSAPPQTSSTTKPQSGKPVPPPPMLTAEPDYRIGVGDVLYISVWREETASGEVIVRPDGKVSPKMIADIFVLGLTTEEVKKLVEEGLKPRFTDGVPEVQVSVKDIKSRIVYITGSVAKPGPYFLVGPMNVNQLITTAGGLLEFANKKNIMLVRGTLKDKNGQPIALFINYEDFEKGKNLQRNNPDLMPGDQVVVR